MSVTVLDALENAEMNFANLAAQQRHRENLLYMIAMSQLKNAIAALDKGLSPYDILPEPQEEGK